MFDFRLNTFLTLCQTKNYTQTAALLHITQPTVTGHIQYLEKRYGVKLFNYANKTLSLTPQGKLLQQFTMTLQSDIEKQLLNIQHIEDQQVQLRFGATLTIGEYTMPQLLSSYLKHFPQTKICMQVDNTQRLLQMLDEGIIDFAFIEGYFDQTAYTHRLLSKENFIAVCSSSHPLAYQTLTLEDLLSETLILREPGSGSRAILEHTLFEHNLPISQFNNLIELGNLNAIKALVSHCLGITFIYEAAVKRELEEGLLAPIHLTNVNMMRAFHFICPSNSLFKAQYLDYFKYFKFLYLEAQSQATSQFDKGLHRIY